MQLILNGKKREFAASVTTISALLTDLNLELKCVAVELNGNILEQSDFDEAVLRQNDVIEIVSFVGGG